MDGGTSDEPQLGPCGDGLAGYLDDEAATREYFREQTPET